VLERSLKDKERDLRGDARAERGLRTSERGSSQARVADAETRVRVFDGEEQTTRSRSRGRFGVRDGRRKKRDEKTPRRRTTF
jgi:hypothetical protein